MRKTAMTLGLMLGLALMAPAIADDGAPVSRLPRVTEPPSDPILQKLWGESRARGGAIINLNLTMGNAPKFARASQAMAYTIRYDTMTPRPIIELVILRTATIVGSRYEQNQHEPMLLGCGYTKPQIDAVRAWRTSRLFDDKQRAVLAYVDAVAGRRGEVDDATYAAFAKHFQPQEISEITQTIGTYYGTGLYTKALRIQVETDGRHAAPGKC
jgi:alkylhydroperoxidase family enzyme